MTEPRAGPPVWIATCGGSGYFPVAPGTAGAALGLALVVGLGHLPFSRPWLITLLAALTLCLFALGVWAASHAERFFGRKDPGQVVIDEVVGQMITFLARPEVRWKWLAAGFLLFRALDVIKPFPARRAEQLPGGWGIMVDDVVAGVYSLVFLWALGIAFK